MDRENILTTLRQHQVELANLGVKSLAIFGSVAQGTATPESDIDILIEFSKSVGLFEFVGIQMHLEKILGQKVDLVTLDAIRESMRDRILADAIYA
jgi:uncharacterized protein